MAYRVVITKPGGPKVLDIQQISIPEPGPEEVCIAVHFAGINFADTLMRLGFYQPRPPFPFTPGYEVSGVVHSIGSKVKGFEIGQRVVGLMRTGGQATHVITDASRALPIPDELSLEAAASMPVTYITAHHMLHHLGNLKPTDSVLIHGGGGGVGTAALQLCQWAGVSKVWSTASAAKAEIIQSYGATAIDRHQEDFTQIIRSATNGKGVDHILDPIGGEHLKRSISVLAQGGKLYTYGMSSAAPSSKRSLWKAFKALRSRPRFDPMLMMSRNQGVFGVHMGTWNDEMVMQEQMENIIKGMKEGALTPIIDSIYDAKDVALAHQHIHDGKNIGKVLLKFVE
ncbi:MAG: alcohol dehydrogenase [Euryarchaeota archaeon]|nr:alcohol dehydrogenase [Euryarchaeota archaeon]|tara:strand:- start:2573 stop:3595 length:1023 start_codon:yes stop_codon:yes gene_type:complete